LSNAAWLIAPAGLRPARPVDTVVAPLRVCPAEPVLELRSRLRRP